jgi:hypothetical protein
MLPDRIDDAVRVAICWVRRHTDDWSVVKHEILTELDNEHRMLFSRRDKLTKEIPEFNALELEVVALWKELTGVTLVRRPLAERREVTWWDPAEAEKIKRRKGRPPQKRKNTGW